MHRTIGNAVAAEAGAARGGPAPAPVSVAMATYNGARFLSEQLHSIAAQSVLPAELVITDDASSDDTLAIARDFAATAPFPVRIHPNPERLGYRANFLRAMGLCASELIALCDQDDVWAATKLERVLAGFDDPEVLLCYHEAWLVDAGGERIGLAHILPLLERNPPSYPFPMVNPYGFAMTFRRELLAFSDLWPRSIDNLHGDERMAHDQWLFFLASALGTTLYVDEPLADYRQHGANTYGFHRPTAGWRARARHWLSVRSHDYAAFVVAARTRAAILDEVATRVDPPWRDRARLAADRYRMLVRHSAWRAAIYGRSGVTGRASAWLDLVRDGAYGNATRWMFGRKAALVDLGCLVLPRRLIHGPSRRP